jgi:hypothetical protein
MVKDQQSDRPPERARSPLPERRKANPRRQLARRSRTATAAREPFALLKRTAGARRSMCRRSAAMLYLVVFARERCASCYRRAGTRLAICSEESKVETGDSRLGAWPGGRKRAYLPRAVQGASGVPERVKSANPLRLNNHRHVPLGLSIDLFSNSNSR